ncbi:hypothetical protein AB9Q52_011090 [Pantoea vagans]|uniref:hypothetical protein n=1 Tax=Pantoea vagans TaxID=470934 RepID=UPI0035133D0F
MNKLTAEKCREQFEEWASTEFDTRLLKFHDGEYKSQALHRMWLAWQASRQALEIALPILEQRGGCNWHYDEADCLWSSECGEDWQFTDGGPEDNRVKFCQGCGQPVVLEQQELGEGEWIEWIEWKGGECPVGDSGRVDLKLHNGHITRDVPASCVDDWSHKDLMTDIIAYRIIPEREESCSN